jgi:hypothetical protein
VKKEAKKEFEAPKKFDMLLVLLWRESSTLQLSRLSLLLHSDKSHCKALIPLRPSDLLFTLYFL